MLDYLEQNPEVFYAVFALILVYNGIMFFRGGRKAEKGFPDIKTQNVIFRDSKASGYSTKNLTTKMGGARKVLDVIVTDKELWIKGSLPMFSFIGSKYDLTHLVPLSNVTNVSANDKNTNVTFTNSVGLTTVLVLQLKDSKKFADAVNG